MIQKKIKTILGELQTVLQTVNEAQVIDLATEIMRAKKIVVSGAGRVGMATRAFGMRLGHFGFQAYTLGDSVVPSIGPEDLFLVSSGSGETQTIYDLVVIAKNSNARIALVTGNPESRMGQLADTIVQIKCPTKAKPIQGFRSIQPMTTLNEQALFIFYDALVLVLMEVMEQTHDTMWERHSNLE